ncbi:hypothetical protein SAMN05216367_1638 [Tardiphaga sp. OK245]|nr:hypothetical protein SAMN05216367_1638 [Tardiphaga sp. OK245]
MFGLSAASNSSFPGKPIGLPEGGSDVADGDHAPGIPTCFALNISGFRVRVRQVPAAPRNDSVGRSASDFVRHSPASNNTYDANTAKGAKTAGFISIRLRDETNLRFHETIFYTDAIGWKPAGTTPPCNK